MPEAGAAPPPRGRVLVCAGTDRGRAHDVARQAARLLAPGRAAVLSAWQPTAGHAPELEPVLESEAGTRAVEAAAAACAILQEESWEVTPVIARDRRRPWQVVLDAAGRQDAELIVAGAADGEGARPGALGSQARALAHRTPVPLLVLPPEAPVASTAPVLFAFDGSGPALAALDAAIELLAPRPAVVVTAWHPVLAAAPAAALAVPPCVAAAGTARLDSAARDAAETTAAAGAARLAAAGWDARSEAVETRSGDWQALVDAADDEDAAVVVCGTRGRSRLAAALLGSVAEGVLRHAGRPVMVVPNRAAP